MNITCTRITSALALVALLATLAGCASRDQDKLSKAQTEVSGDDMEKLPDLPVDIASIDFDPARDLRTVYFDFDSARLTDPSRMTLDYNAGRMKEAASEIVQVVGHCDERGTQEYNLALGERRAQETRNYLRQQGIPGDRIITMSYGEEFPAVPGSNEAAWARNRRCEFMRAPMN